MRQPVRYVRTIVALGLALVTANPAPIGAAIYDDASAITLPSGDLSTEATSIRKVLEAYVRAVEAKDVQMFRAVKPNLSEEEEKRARVAFKSVQSQVVRMNVVALDVKDGEGDGEGLPPRHDQRLDREQLPADLPAREGDGGLAHPGHRALGRSIAPPWHCHLSRPM